VSEVKQVSKQANEQYSRPSRSGNVFLSGDLSGARKSQGKQRGIFCGLSKERDHIKNESRSSINCKHASSPILYLH
jgi:hypothetical protein